MTRLSKPKRFPASMLLVYRPVWTPARTDARHFGQLVPARLVMQVRSGCPRRGFIAESFDTWQTSTDDERDRGDKTGRIFGRADLPDHDLGESAQTRRDLENQFGLCGGARQRPSAAGRTRSEGQVAD